MLIPQSTNRGTRKHDVVDVAEAWQKWNSQGLKEEVVKKQIMENQLFNQI